LIGVLIVWLQRHPERIRPLMKTFGEKGDMSARSAPHTPLRRRFLSLPHTRLGWWAVGLATSFVAVFLINGLVLMTAPIPIRAVAIAYGFVFIAVGLGSGVVATLALAYKHERSARSSRRFVSEGSHVSQYAWAIVPNLFHTDVACNTPNRCKSPSSSK